jgi:hypothetical protein
VPRWFVTSDVFDFQDVRRFVARPFSMDLRGLALLRIGLGLVVLADLAQRSVMLTAHYTDQGVLPSSLAESEGRTTRANVLRPL